MPGASLHEELELLVEAGFTPLEALQAATLNPAIFFGISDSFGTVETGRIADLVLLEGNPLVDMRNTKRIVAVFSEGKLLDRRALNGMVQLTALERSYNARQFSRPLKQCFGAAPISDNLAGTTGS